MFDDKLYKIQFFKNKNIFFSQDLEKWVEGRQEVEIIDMILRVKQKLKIIDEMPTEYLPQSVIVQNNNTRQQLLRHLDDMKKQLPEDLKKILNNK